MNRLVSIFTFMAIVQIALCHHNKIPLVAKMPVVYQPSKNRDMRSSITNSRNDPFRNEFIKYYIMHAEQMMKIMRALQDLQRGCVKKLHKDGKYHYHC